MPVRPSLIALGALPGLLLTMSLVTVTISSHAGQDSVYTVAALHIQLAHRPAAWAGRRAWIGRTVRVRGRAQGCNLMPAPIGPRCARWEPRLGDPDGGATSEPLLLARADPNPALAFLRRLPLVSQLVPAPQQIWWGALPTYRVRLRAAPILVCGMPPCYEALLLDAASDPPSPVPHEPN